MRDMKFHQEDPKLTSYVLGELSPEDTAKLEYAIAADPALRLAIEEIERSQSDLGEALGGGSHTLLPRQRGAILSAAKEAGRKGRVNRLESHRQVQSMWAWPVAAAAVIGGGIFLMTLVSPNEPKRGKKPVSRNGSENVELTTEGGLPGDVSIVNLPLIAGKLSLSIVTNAVREKREMPAKSDVRIEEFLNGFPLHTRGSVALWKGCSIGAEVIPCPWKPSASLVFVDIRGAKDKERNLAVKYHKNEESVLEYRILGYRSISDKNIEQTARTMEPGAKHFLAILVTSSGDDLGSIEWMVDGEAAPAVQLEKEPEKEPSDDARFAALVCSYGLWLRGEDAIDDDMLLGLAREVAAKSVVPDRYDFLELVDQTVKLSSE